VSSAAATGSLLFSLLVVSYRRRFEKECRELESDVYINIAYYVFFLFEKALFESVFQGKLIFMLFHSTNQIAMCCDREYGFIKGLDEFSTA
jgi:hypothetical protein